MLGYTVHGTHLVGDDTDTEDLQYRGEYEDRGEDDFLHVSVFTQKNGKWVTPDITNSMC